MTNPMNDALLTRQDDGGVLLELGGMTYLPDDMLPSGKMAADAVEFMQTGSDHPRANLALDYLIVKFQEQTRRRSSRRPRTKSDADYKARLGVRVTPETRARLEREAEAKGEDTTMSSLAAEAIEAAYPGGEK